MLNEVKNLKALTNGIQILRFTQDDTFLFRMTN